uniref:ATP-dependent Clp protease proteolytic subunit n=1 Tax=Jasminum tortuosum TaxID=1548298 RepID=A0A1W6C9R2_9LAMI|nr:ATP-dependent Clp protease proteolytic subunit [Jasminum tortuosum]ARJ61451.1 ATP-dependent Clp protease proteolytic subunit [Jasminum tortuosum]
MPIGLPRVPFNFDPSDSDSDSDNDYGYDYDHYHDDDNDTEKDENEKVKAEKEEVWTDLYTKLYQLGILFLGEEIEFVVANEIIAAMLYLNMQDPLQRLYFFINSPGGAVHDGLAIYDAMKYIDQEIHTICYGQAASMASVLLASGAKGHRGAYPHSMVMMHQPALAPTRGRLQRLVRERNCLNILKERIIDIYVCETRKDRLVIERTLERDHYMSPIEAREYGIIDKIYGGIFDKIEEDDSVGGGYSDDNPIWENIGYYEI